MGATTKPKAMQKIALENLRCAYSRCRSEQARVEIAAAMELVGAIDLGKLAQQKFADGWDAAINKLTKVSEDNQSPDIEEGVTA